MRTTEQIIAGLEGERTTARTEAAVARCDQQLAVHRQIGQLNVDRAELVARAAAAGKVAVVDDRIAHLSRLVDERPTVAAVPPARTAASTGSEEQSDAGKPERTRKP